VLIAGDGRTFAVRGPDGRLAFHHSGGDSFATREWLAADADGRDVKDKGLGQGIACDASGCIGKLADGALVSYALEPDAFEEDCRRTMLVLATHDDPPPDCAATVIGRDVWRRRGALALRRDGPGFIVDGTRAENFDRPWAPAIPPRRSAIETTSDSNPDVGAPRAQPRDATPRQEDIEADQ